MSGRRHPFSGGRVAIVGAGPCGLACARELERLGHSDWRIFEASTTAGGHASSVRDEQGFTWDLGGHVVFSHYGEFDALLDEVIGDDAYEHERSSYVHLDDRWIPYPFQNNLRHLAPERVHECLLGLIEAPGGSTNLDFASWIDATFGAGIARHFMRPYNFKVWATPLERMSSTWIAERVSVVDYQRALRNVLFELDDVGWGPNNRFRFPKTGGTGEIYRRLAERLGDRVVFEKEVVAVDPGEHFLTFADGTGRSTRPSSRQCLSTAWSRSSKAVPQTCAEPRRRSSTPASTWLGSGTRDRWRVIAAGCTSRKTRRPSTG